MSAIGIIMCSQTFAVMMLYFLAKGRSQKIKMEILDGICHEGGGSRGGLECHLPILKNDFFKNHLESFPDCENVFCT